MEQRNIQKGDTVFSQDGHKIGSVESIDTTYFELSTGFLGLGHPYFVPFSAVSRVDSQNRHVYLNVTKDNLANQGWEHRPTPGQTAAPAGTMGGTMPAATTERPAQTVQNSQDLQGRTLFDWNHQRIGQIEQVRSNYAEVHPAMSGLGNRLFVPFDAISYCTNEGCFVNASADQIGQCGWNQPPPQAAAAAGQRTGTITIPLYSEEIQVRKHREQIGEVIVHRHVVQEQRTVDVPVEHDDVTIERRMVNEPVPAGENPFADAEKEIRVPIYEEKVNVETRPVLREEVVVNPEQVVEQQQVHETVRREVPEVNLQGDVSRVVQGEEQFTNQPAENPANVTRPVTNQPNVTRPAPEVSNRAEQVAHKYGYDAARSQRYQNDSWSTAESSLADAWNNTNPNTPWSSVRSYVQDGWNQGRNQG
jgi:uncharacterized protein (TIGR02271 family)